MFALRGIAISFSLFVMLYCALSLAVKFTWRKAWHYGQSYRPGTLADLLFGLRLFPLATAIGITVAFTIPSFLLLEPRSIDEPVGELPLVFAIFGICLGILGIRNAVISLRQASRAISAWTRDSHPVEGEAPVPVVRISASAPPLTAAGIIRPRVLLSEVAEFLLTGDELQSAVNHEIAHVRRRERKPR